MKRHEGCSISGSVSDIEIPLLSTFSGLPGQAETVDDSLMIRPFSCLKHALRCDPFQGPVRDGEFDWGGTSVKE